MGMFRIGRKLPAHKPQPVVQIEFPAIGESYYKNEFGVYQIIGNERRLIASFPKVSDAITAHPSAQLMSVGYTSFQRIAA